MYFDYPKPRRGKGEEYVSAHISGVNPRAELHGDERKPAMDLGIELSVNVDELALLAIDKEVPNYREQFYNEKGQLKGHKVKKLVFDREFENHSVGISFSVVKTAESAHRFRLEKMKKFSAEFQPGFIVTLRFQIQLHPNEQDGGMLYHKGLSNDECWVNFRHEQKDMVAEAGKDGDADENE